MFATSSYVACFNTLANVILIRQYEVHVNVKIYMLKKEIFHGERLLASKFVLQRKHYRALFL